LRLKRGLEAFEVGKAMDMIKTKMRERTERKIKNDPNVGEDTINDHNNIEEIMLTGYTLKTLKLVIIILNLSYFLGLVWIIFCKLTEKSLKA
jgi:hypothetical protein